MRLLASIALAILSCSVLSSAAQAHHHYHRHHWAHAHHHHWAFGHRRHFADRHRHTHHRWAYRLHSRHHLSWRHAERASFPQDREAVYGMVTRSAIAHGLPPALAHGIVRVESGYNCGAYHAGAAGIMQVKPATARSVGIYGGLRSCRNGLEAGMRYLQQAYALANGNSSYAATLYNRGLAARPTRSGYSRSVMWRSYL